MSESPAPRFAIFRGESGKYSLYVAVISLVVRLIPAYFVYGSFDVGAWILVIRENRVGHNPYATGKLNWPPLWPILLLYTARMENVYDLPSHFSVKIIPCVADSVIAVVLYFWFIGTTGTPSRAFRRSLWYALNPVAIATCALHGQFESLPCLFSLLAIIEVTRRSTTAAGSLSWRSAVWLGLGGMAKTWPLFLMPAALRSLRSWRRQALYASVAVAPTVLSVGLLYLNAPDIIAKNVLSYRSAAGLWGLTSFNAWFPKEIGEAWAHINLWILYLGWIVTYALTWRKGSAGQVAVLGLLTFYVLTPGWGPQYLAWIVPLAILVDFRRAVYYTGLASVSLAILYICMPYYGNGEYFNFLLNAHTPHFWDAFYSERFLKIQAIPFLPLWLYCIWWWAVLYRDILQGSASQKEGSCKENLERV